MMALNDTKTIPTTMPRSIRAGLSVTLTPVLGDDDDDDDDDGD
jgi:hypothetical protein